MSQEHPKGRALGRPASELRTIDDCELQLFVFLHVLNWRLPKVTIFFDELFEQMAGLTGHRTRIT